VRRPDGIFGFPDIDVSQAEPPSEAVSIILFLGMPIPA
jgi:hypothetical protein